MELDMNDSDREAIDGIFARLRDVAARSAPRDGEAEEYIRRQMDAMPGAAYYLAQSVMVQEQALKAAQAQMETLRRGAGTGVAGTESTFGRTAAESGAGAAAGAAPGAAPGAADPRGPQPGQASDWRSRIGLGGGAAPGAPAAAPAQPAGGGFLASAMQTAMGVAGGVVLGNFISNLFGGHAAQAAPVIIEETPAPPPDTSPNDGSNDTSSYDDDRSNADPAARDVSYDRNDGYDSNDGNDGAGGYDDGSGGGLDDDDTFGGGGFTDV
jgi:hypothetical protein